MVIFDKANSKFIFISKSEVDNLGKCLVHIIVLPFLGTRLYHELTVLFFLHLFQLLKANHRFIDLVGQVFLRKEQGNRSVLPDFFGANF